METKIELLDQLGILGGIRQRLGAKDENDTSFDQRIEGMSNRRLVALDTGWELGDESWANNIFHLLDELNESFPPPQK